MDKSLVVLVTGASSGMGKDFAKALLKEGMVVYGAARRVSHMDDIKELGAIPIGMDITKEEDIQQVVQRIIKEQGRIDVLINNAGFATYGSIEDTSLADARYQLEVNLFGLARLTQLILPYMRKQGSGKIINISSMAGQAYFPLLAWYHASKYALEGWSDCLRLEVKLFGIDVVIIEPGLIHTEFADASIDALLTRSGEGAYQGLARDVHRNNKASYTAEAASPPGVISKVVVEAIKAKNPKTRYAAGKLARPVLLMRRWLGDKLYDKIIMYLNVL